jgi:hypothetical protein
LTHTQQFKRKWRYENTKKSTCYKCPFYARYEAENDRQKVIAICEKSMRIFPKIDVFGLEVIVDDEIPDWCELEDNSVTLPYSPVPPKKTEHPKRKHKV